MRQVREMEIIQIDITNACDGPACSNCTRMLKHHKKPYQMDFDTFKRAVESLRMYPGVVGLFGGNPCLHKDFRKFVEHFIEARPDKKLRGLWSNGMGQHSDLYDTFGCHVYNTHTQQCYHQPTMIAIQDVVDESVMWGLIDQCSVNLRWSACVTPKGVYFCEIAAAWDMVYDEDHALPITDGWWEKDLSEFECQKRRWCPNCSMALPLPARLDKEAVDDVSARHLPVCNPSRKVEVFDVESYELAKNKTGWSPLEYKDTDLRKKNILRPRTKVIRMKRKSK